MGSSTGEPALCQTRRPPESRTGQDSQPGLCPPAGCHSLRLGYQRGGCLVPLGDTIRREFIDKVVHIWPDLEGQPTVNERELERGWSLSPRMCITSGRQR